MREGKERDLTVPEIQRIRAEAQSAIDAYDGTSPTAAPPDWERQIVRMCDMMLALHDGLRILRA